jgi:hypothetical protein
MWLECLGRAILRVPNQIEIGRGKHTKQSLMLSGN